MDEFDIGPGERELLATYERLHATWPSTATTCRRSPSATRSRRWPRCGRSRTGSARSPGRSTTWARERRRGGRPHAGRARRARRVRGARQRQLPRHAGAARRRRGVPPRPPRGRRDLHGRRLRARERAGRRLQRPPGAGLHQRADRADRGGQGRTPLLLVCRRGARAALRSNFRVDQEGWPPRSARCPSASTRARPPPPTPRGRCAARAPSAGPWCSTCRSTSRPRGAGAGAAPRRCGRRRAGPRRRRRPSRRSRTLIAAARRPRDRRRAAARCWPARASRWSGSATRSAPCSRPRRWGTGCSPARRGRSGSPAGSPRRSRRGWSASPTWSSPSAPR